MDNILEHQHVFGNWEADSVNLGFVFKDDNGKVTIPDEQLQNIINFDKMCLSIDGSQGRRGGSQRMFFMIQDSP